MNSPSMFSFSVDKHLLPSGSGDPDRQPNRTLEPRLTEEQVMLAGGGQDLSPATMGA